MDRRCTGPITGSLLRKRVLGIAGLAIGMFASVACGGCQETSSSRLSRSRTLRSPVSA